MTDELTALRARVAEMEAAALDVVGANRDSLRESARGNVNSATITRLTLAMQVEILERVLRSQKPTPDPRDTSLPWPCTCGRTDANGCDRCDPRDARIAELGSTEDPPTVEECLKLRECMDSISTAACALPMFEVRHEGMEEAATANICKAIVGAASRIAELEAALREVMRLCEPERERGFGMHDADIEASYRTARRALGDAHG